MNLLSFLIVVSIIYVLNYFFELKDVLYDDKINMKRLNCFFNVYKKNLNILFFLKNIDFIFDKYVIFIFQKNCFYLVWYYFNIYYGKVMK